MAKAQDEPRFRIAHLARDPALRKSLTIAEDDHGSIPVLPKDEKGAHGSDDARSIFHRAYCEASVERALYELVWAQRALASCRGEESGLLAVEWNVARDRMMEAFERLAAIPAMSSDLLSRKKRMIGPRWLRLHSVFSDAVARDEAYLRTKARGPRKSVAEGEL
jgi:hypothetical protein